MLAKERSTKDSGTKKAKSEMDLESNSGLMDPSMKDVGRGASVMGKAE